MSGGPEDKAAPIEKGGGRLDEWLVTHDGLIALSGALGGEDGIVAIAGTGSMAFGRRGKRSMRAGGWGYIYGDEGGAFWIVKQALRAVLRYEEGWGPETRPYIRCWWTRPAERVPRMPSPASALYARLAALAKWRAWQMRSPGRGVDFGDEIAARAILCQGGRCPGGVCGSRSYGRVLWEPGRDMVKASYTGGTFRSRCGCSFAVSRIAGKSGWNVE